MDKVNEDVFPLSTKKSVKGTRRLAREKILQILMASEISGVEWQVIFDHIFFRNFNFGDDEFHSDKILTQDEVKEIESDLPINWNFEEIDFAKFLVDTVIKSKEALDAYILGMIENWELDRITVVDRILLEMAISELLYCPDIPPKVSLNEAIEIAKLFSTEKSWLFINGILDKLLTKFKQEDTMKKTGRGLVEK